MLGVLCGCAAERAERIDVWVGDDVYPGSIAVSTRSGAEPSGETERQVTLAGAINETLGVSLTLSPPRSPVEGLTVRATDLRTAGGAIPANAISIFRVHEVEPARMPGWYLRSVPPRDRVTRVPDVLVPVDAPEGGLPVDLPIGGSVTLWVDVNIPKGSAPGTYSGTIDVLAGDAMLTSIEVRLTVWPFVLPDSADVVLLGELDHALLFGHHVSVDGHPVALAKQWGNHPAAAELDNLLTTGMRLLQTHKVAPLLTGLTPVARVDAEGAVEVNWDEYDRVTAPFIDGRRFFDRQPLPLWQIPLTEEFPTPPAYGAMLSAKHSGVARQYLARCAEHFARRGWLERCFVRLPQVTVGDPEAYAAVRHFGRIARLADPRLRTMVPLFPQDVSACGWEGFIWEEVSRYIDIWSPPAQFYDRREMEQERLRGKRSFWSLDRPPFSGSLGLRAHPADTRVIGWQARASEVEAVWLGVVNDWPAAGPRPATPQTCCQAGAAPLIYPGRFCGLFSPIPSVRLKRLRRSMQDAAYLKLLNDRGLEHIASALTESLAPRAGAEAYGAHFADGRSRGWMEQPELWACARQIMADEIARSIRQGALARADDSPAPGEASAGDLANTVQWRRFMEQTRRLEVTVDGVRVRPFGPPSTGRMEVSVSVTVTNRTRVPISGRLAFEELPLAWEPEEPQVAFDEIAPQKSRRITLRAVAAVMETDAGGVLYLPITLRSSDRRVYHLAARLSYLAVHLVDRPLTVDGDLSDWPAAVGNAAEDFVLITGEDPEAVQLPHTRAARDTQCFVACDGAALYFGFNCMLGDQADLPRSQRNYVQYQDGVPVGEEMIEVLIAPDNTGTRSPADFYHVVLKPHGSFWERGIGTDPPVGARSPWAANIRTAVQIQPDKWVAEVCIPLDAFGGANTSRTVWGLNFTRFDLSGQEFANWSGATRNVYDPLAAGNLAWP